MKIEVKIEKRYALLIIGLLLVFGGVFAVYAFNSNPANPSKLGHSADEVQGTVVGGGMAFGDALSLDQKSSALPCVDSATDGPLGIGSRDDPKYLWGEASCDDGTNNKLLKCHGSNRIVVAVAPGYLNYQGSPKTATFYYCIKN
ncbi:hypothetical protein KW787_00595 [Candidatus Pacearchaeota archaeon]|nr:hypothetical protein [Candidatus Pacearchaeota archaeon]